MGHGYALNCFSRGSCFTERDLSLAERQTFAVSYSEQGCLHLINALASFTTGRNDSDIWL